MIEEKIDLSLNVAALPKRQKRAKLDYGQSHVSSEELNISSYTGVENNLKQKKPSIWKEFKKANKSKNHVVPSVLEENNTKEHKSNKNVKRTHNATDSSFKSASQYLKYNQIGDQYTKEKKSIPGKQTSLFHNNPDIPVIAHKAVRPLQEKVFSDSCFSDTTLHPYMVKYLAESMGLTKMTVVQEKTIPVLLKNKDALICSQTGSGKTLAYALPILHHLQKLRPKIKRNDGVMALIVVPTKELALQTYEIFNKLVKSYTWIVPGHLVGGQKRKSEKARLRKGISILIGTPGRLVDHIHNTKCLSLERVTWLVIDEADRLFDMGYEKDIASIIASLAKGKTSLLKPHYINPEENVGSEESRHTVLLSATLTPKVKELAGLSLSDEVFIDACDEKTSAGSAPTFSTYQDGMFPAFSLPKKLLHQYVIVPAKLRLVGLTALIYSNSKMGGKILVFVGTQEMADYHWKLFSAAVSTLSQDEGNECTLSGTDIFCFHGGMSFTDRRLLFDTFREADRGVLFCTDVAARGLDIDDVDWVVQYTPPTSVCDYVHRVGRTARAGSGGNSMLFLLPSEVSFIHRLEEHRIRPSESTTTLDSLLGSTRLILKDATSVEDAASSLQMLFETIVYQEKDSELYPLACTAYSSWTRFYSSYPRDLKGSFNIKDVHQGHYAKSFALRDPPKTIISRSKGMNVGFARRPKDRKRSKPREPLPNRAAERLMEISEFASGLEPPRKKAKKAGSKV